MNMKSILEPLKKPGIIWYIPDITAKLFRMKH
jgi:hypothetical protein